MEAIKNLVNVLSGASISFALLSMTFGMIVYFNLLDGKLKSRAGYIFVALGVVFVLAGLFFTPLLILGLTHFALLFLLSRLGPRLWDKKVGLIALVTTGVIFTLSMFDQDFFTIAGKPDNVPI